jgi:hypothetical protein
LAIERIKVGRNGRLKCEKEKVKKQVKEGESKVLEV